LGAELTGERNTCLFLCVGALDKSERSSSSGRQQQHDGTDEQPFQPPVLAALPRELALVLGPALGEELALELVQLPLPARRPVERRLQAPAAVEIRCAPILVVPAACALRQMLPQLAPLRVLAQPLLEPRPLAKQRLVRDLHRILVSGQKSIV